MPKFLPGDTSNPVGNQAYDLASGRRWEMLGNNTLYIYSTSKNDSGIAFKRQEIYGKLVSRRLADDSDNDYLDPYYQIHFNQETGVYTATILLPGKFGVSDQKFSIDLKINASIPWLITLENMPRRSFSYPDKPKLELPDVLTTWFSGTNAQYDISVENLHVLCELISIDLLDLWNHQ